MELSSKRHDIAHSCRLCLGSGVEGKISSPTVNDRKQKWRLEKSKATLPSKYCVPHSLCRYPFAWLRVGDGR